MLDEPGYDEATQLWYMPASKLALPTIPDKPTREEAIDALNTLQKGTVKGRVPGFCAQRSFGMKSGELEAYSAQQLADMVARHAVRFQGKNKNGAWVDIDPPKEIIIALHAST
jgi:hypothetical protein